MHALQDYITGGFKGSSRQQSAHRTLDVHQPQKSEVTTQNVLTGLILNVELLLKTERDAELRPAVLRSVRGFSHAFVICALATVKLIDGMICRL